MHKEHSKRAARRRVRVVLIRHAESEDNVIGLRLGAALASGEMTAKQAAAAFKEQRFVDAPLSSRGRAQARALAAHWAPLLARLENEGGDDVGDGRSVELCCSPMLRSCETAQPLHAALSRLRQQQRAGGSGGGGGALRVIVRPDIFEAQGLVPKGGDVHAPTGMGAAEIRRRFGVGCFDTALLPHGDAPWCATGYERRAEQLARATRVAAWLKGLPASRAPGSSLVCVGHSDFMSLLVRALLPAGAGAGDGGASFDFTNTSVSSVLVDDRGGCSVEFLNRAEHLEGGELANNPLSAWASKSKL